MQINTMEEAVTVYRKLESKIAAKQEAFDKDVAPLKQGMEQLTVIMRAMMNQAGATRMNIPGVAEVAIVAKRTFSSSDWDKTYSFLVANDCPEILQKRIHEANMQQWIDDHPEAGLPPGVSVYTENVLKVLKGK